MSAGQSEDVYEDVQNPLDPADGSIEGDSSTPAAKEKRKMDPTFKRNVIIVGAVAVVGVATTGLVLSQLFSSSPSKAAQNAAAVSVGNAPAQTVTEEGQQLSPVMAAALKEAEKREYAQAVNTGQQVFVGSQAAVNVEPIKQPQPASLDVPPPPYPVNNAVSSQPVPDTGRSTRQQEGLNVQLTALLKYAQPEADMPARIEMKVSQQAQGAQVQGGQSQQPSGAVPVSANGAAATESSARAARGTIMADALEIFAAELTSDVDMYRTTFCSARIVAGRLSGAYLVGACRQSDEGLSMTFNRMRIGTATLGIQAIAMDEGTSTDAMSNANIDRRYLQRYAFPIGTAVLGGAAAARARPNNSITQSVTGSVISQPSATREQAIAEGVSAGMQVLGGIVQREASRPVHITMKAGSPIGVMFMSPVFSGQTVTGAQ